MAGVPQEMIINRNKVDSVVSNDQAALDNLFCVCSLVSLGSRDDMLIIKGFQFDH